MEEGNLGIADHLGRMRHDPFFLVAATGLGKTVVVPVHVWLRQCERTAPGAAAPTTWIVEPRVLIAEDQARYMESSVSKLLRARGSRDVPPIFGSITAKGSYNPKAPIKFVTTGVFTAKALSGDFSPETDRIVIDEAHETIAQNADVEIGISVARSSGIHIDYMSATVDTVSIPELLRVAPQDVIVATNKRFPIFTVNASRTLADCLLDIVDATLVRRDRESPYVPPHGYPERDRILRDVFDGPPRSHALLVALNSITGPRSDLATARKLLAEAPPLVDGQPIDVLELSSKQTGSESEMARFDARRADIEKRNRPYIVLATSVIEMGVTIPALDFVVTMDSGFQSVLVGDRMVPQIAPLPFNSLKQRLGRVGRKRAGIGIITREVGASYTDFDVVTLNSDSIEFEPVRTPLATSRLDSLALYTIKQAWSTPREIADGIRTLGLASESALLTLDRLRDLVAERRVLLALGAGDTKGLTKLGVATEAWIGAGWLPYAFKLEQGWQDKSDIPSVMFWLVALATSESDLSSFLANNATIDELNDAGRPSGAGVGFVDNLHSPLGRYDLLRAFYNTYARHVVADDGLQAVSAAATESLRRDCQELDLVEAQIFNAMRSISSLRNRFAKVHRIRSRSRIPHDLPALSGALRRQIISEAHAIPGQVSVTVGRLPDGHPDARAWYNADGKAIATVANSVPRLGSNDPDVTYTARLVMRNEADSNGFWLEVADAWVQAPL